MTKTFLTNDTMHPEVRAFMASLPKPDAALLEHAETYAALAARSTALRQRGIELTARVPALDAQLVDTEAAPGRAKLLAERSRILGELAALPPQRQAITRRLVVAHLTFLQRLAVVAHAEAQTAADGLEEPRRAVSVLRRREARADGGDGAAKLTPDERTALQAEVATLVAGMRPLVARRDAALLVAGIAQAKAAAYGDDVRLRPDPRTESSPFEMVAERVARQAA